MIVIFCANKFEILSFFKKIKILKKINKRQINGIFGTYKKKGYKNSCRKKNFEILILFTGIGKKNAKRAAYFFMDLLKNIKNYKSILNIQSNLNHEYDWSLDNKPIFLTKKRYSIPISDSNFIEIQQIIITGFTGSLSKDIKINDVVLIKKVELFNGKKTSKKINLKSLTGLKEDIAKINFNKEANLVTSNSVLNTSNTKLTLKKYTGANVVDMETYYIAQDLQRLKIPQLYFRVVSDDLNNNIPEFLNNFLDIQFNANLKNKKEKNIFLYKYKFNNFLNSFFLHIIILVKLTFQLIKKPANIINFIKFLKKILTAQKILSKKIEYIIDNIVCD